MVQLKINSEGYKAFDTWDEMPWSKAMELWALCKNEMPVTLKELYESYAKGPEKDDEIKDKISDEDIIKNFPEFYGKAIKCLSDIPQEIIDKITSGNRVQFYSTYVFKFVFGVMHYPIDFESKGIKSFNHKGTEYYFPKSENVLGEIRPMADRKVIEFAEAADLQLFSKQLEGGNIEKARNIVSILCRPIVGNNIEPYNQETCLKRAEEFNDLPMNIVWEVFFCLTQHLVLSKQSTVLSSLRDRLQSLQKQEREVV